MADAAAALALSERDQQRLSTNAVRRRLSSAAVVLSTGNNQDAVLEATRQRHEDKKRRISIVSPKLLRPEKANDDIKPTTAEQQPSSSRTKAFDLLSPDDATEHYRQCLRLAIENKINKKNAFDLKLIENLETLLTGKNRQNFALCASLVDVGTRIFGSRVDANDVELKRICTWLCGGDKKDDDNEDLEKEDGKEKPNKDGGEYGGNDSVLMEGSIKKPLKSQSRKVVVEEDNNKLSAALEKRSKANPLMRGRRSALAASGISEGLSSVLLLPSLAVTETHIVAKDNRTSTTLQYVVSEAADSTFSQWINHTAQQPLENPTFKKPRWSFDELGKIDLSKDICPPLRLLDLNKPFGQELEETYSKIEDVSCEEALKSHVINQSEQDDGITLPSVAVEPGHDDDSFEMPALEDQSMNPDVFDSSVADNKDVMLLVPVESQNQGPDLQASSSLPLASAPTFTIDQLHDVLAQTVATENIRPGDDGQVVPPSWLLEQLVNGTVGKALKMRPKSTSDSKESVTAKPRRNLIKVQKVSFSEDLYRNAEEKLTVKLLPKSTKKIAQASITGENDLPDPVVSSEFDEMLRALRDCFIMAGVASSNGGRTDENLFTQNSGDFGAIGNDFDRDDDADYDNDDNINVDPIFAADLEASSKSFVQQDSLILQKNLEELCNENKENQHQIGEGKETSAGSSLSKQLLNQVRNASGSLSSALLLRRIDVRVAKSELWNSVEQRAPATRMSVVIPSANDKLSSGAAATNPSNKTNSSRPAFSNTLTPQMAFVCLLHLANEHNLGLQSSGHFSDIEVNLSAQAKN